MNEGRIFVEIFQMSNNIKFNRTKRAGCPNWFDMIIQCIWTNRFGSLDYISNEFLRCRLFSFMKFWIQMPDSILEKKTLAEYVCQCDLIFKDPLVSKCLFGVFNFLQKKNQNKST